MAFFPLFPLDERSMELSHVPLPFFPFSHPSSPYVIFGPLPPPGTSAAVRWRKWTFLPFLEANPVSFSFTNGGATLWRTDQSGCFSFFELISFTFPPSASIICIAWFGQYFLFLSREGLFFPMPIRVRPLVERVLAFPLSSRGKAPAACILFPPPPAHSLMFSFFSFVPCRRRGIRLFQRHGPK